MRTVPVVHQGAESTSDIYVYIEIILLSQVFSIPTIFGIVTRFAGILALHRQLTYVECWIYCFAYLSVIAVVVHELVFIIKKKDFNPNLKLAVIGGK